MKKFVVVGLLILISLSSHAQATIIKGKNKDYSNKELKLYTYFDRITFTPSQLDSCLVDSSGNFIFSFQQNTINQVFINLQTKQGFLLAQSGKTYVITLPPYQPMSVEQKLDPYFSPKPILLPVINIDSNDINWKVRVFDHYYKIILNQLVIRKIENPDTVEYTINLLDKNTPNDTSRFYCNYKKYCYVNIRLATYMKDLWPVAKQYFLHSSPLLNNPAYMSAFNDVFDNCLSPLKHFFPSMNFIRSLTTHRFSVLVDSFMTIDTNINRQTAQLIILRGLYDLFYDYKPAQEKIIATIDDAQQTLTDPTMRLIAQNIYNKITALRVGYPPPEFSLPNHLGLKKSLRNYRGKFIYLNFCHSQSLACQKQLPLLQRYAQSAPKDFLIVTIMYGVKKKDFGHFTKKYRSSHWIFLNGEGHADLINKYKVVAFPTYYLIDPNGYISLSPAPAPTEDFNQLFVSKYKKWHLEHRKKEAGIKASNYFQ